MISDDQSIAVIDANDTARALASVTIDSQERAEWAALVIGEVAEQNKGYETARDKIAKPAYRSYKEARALFAQPIATNKATIADLKQKVKAYRDRVAAEQTAALAAVVDMPPEAARAEVARAVVATAPVPAGLVEREAWTWEIEDAAKIPRDYYVLDEQRIGREIRASKGATQIPGIRVVRDTIMVRK